MSHQPPITELEALGDALRSELEVSKHNRDAMRELREDCARFTRSLEALAVEVQRGSLRALRSVG